MSNLENIRNIDKLTPEDLSKDLITSLAGYESITVYNNIINLIPFEEILDKKIKEAGHEARETTNIWMKKVETPFKNIFFEINALLVKDILPDLEVKLKDFLDDRSDRKLNDVKDIVTDYNDGLKKWSEYITATNEEVDNFRESLSADARNFADIEKRMPDIIKDNDENIIDFCEKKKKKEQKITDITNEIRENDLKLLQVGDDIRKAGIACAIPLVQIGGAIAMAVLLGKKSDLKQSNSKLENDLEENKKLHKQYSEKLREFEGQVPLLNAMTTQVPILFALSQQAGNAAMGIKHGWDEINHGLKSFELLLDINIEQTNRSLKKIPDKIKQQKNELEILLNNFNKSMRLGYPVTPEAQKAFGIQSRMRSQYYYSDNNTGLLYVSEAELYEITTNVRARYK